MPAHVFVALRALHVLAGSVWVGAAIFNALYVVPSVIASGPAGGQVMRELAQVRRMPVFMNATMLVTLITGLYIYVRVSGGLHPAWIVSGPGITLTMGAVLAFVTAGIGQFVTVPAVRRMGALGAAIAAGGGPPTPEQAAEMGALQRRLLAGVQVGALLVALATVFMAVARFM